MTVVVTPTELEGASVSLYEKRVWIYMTGYFDANAKGYSVFRCLYPYKEKVPCDDLCYLSVTGNIFQQNIRNFFIG